MVAQASLKLQKSSSLSLSRVRIAGVCHTGPSASLVFIQLAVAQPLCSQELEVA